jgi:enoyl-CoA hydratase/carnithine racemase
MSERVTISIDSGIADVRLDRPDKRNALDGQMFAALAAAGASLVDERSVRAVVLSGNGASFCAGLDFGAFEAIAASGADGFEGADSPGRIQPGGLTHLGQQICWIWQQLPVPVIAAVHGHALGGGLQIALGADIRIVHPDTKLSMRELHWGLIPDMTGTLTLAGLVRPDVAKELVFSARVFDGREAERIGLATRLSESPLEEAMALAAEIAARNPDAVRAAKRLLNRFQDELARGQFAAEREEIGALLGSPNQIEAVTANFENRAARFVDR